MRSLSCFLRAVAVRVWVIPIRVVVVRRARIDGIENDSEDTALDTTEKIARPSEGFLGRFSAPNDEQDAVRLYGNNHSIRSSQDRGRINNDKLVFCAQLGDGVGELM